MTDEKEETTTDIWEVPDELWKRIEPLILEFDPPKDTGRPRINPRHDKVFARWRFTLPNVMDNLSKLYPVREELL